MQIVSNHADGQMTSVYGCYESWAVKASVRVPTAVAELIVGDGLAYKVNHGKAIQFTRHGENMLKLYDHLQFNRCEVVDEATASRGYFGSQRGKSAQMGPNIQEMVSEGSDYHRWLAWLASIVIPKGWKFDAIAA